MTNDRKPKVTSNGELKSAYDVLNEFLKEKNIALGFNKPQISFTDNNQIVISPPQIIALYKDQVKKEELND